MRLMSHRGAAGLERENSIAGIRRAAAFAPAFIEVDVHRTSDGVFVLHHGDLKRTYLGAPLDGTYEQLKGAAPELLSLEEFLKYEGSVPFILDIKVRGHTEELAAALSSAAPEFHGAFTSPHALTLKKLQNAFPYALTMISQPYYEGPLKAMKLARTYGFGGISLNKWWLNPFTYIGCRRHLLKVMVYSVDHSLTMRLIKRFYPDVFIVSNRPDVYRTVVSITEEEALNQ